jgi:hypothetical protein
MQTGRRTVQLSASRAIRICTVTAKLLPASHFTTSQPCSRRRIEGGSSELQII